MPLELDSQLARHSLDIKDRKQEMKKIALLFPGQGAQYVGMGKSLKGTPQESYLKKADATLGYSISKLMLEGPEEELTLTQNTQPAILAYSLSLYEQVWEILREKECVIQTVMGHSVGEYAALAAAGVLSFEDAVKAVHLRGQYMQSAVPAGVGKMVAVMKVPEDIVVSSCKEASTEAEQVMPANFNEPNQIVISGHGPACDRASEIIEKKMEGNCRLVPLKVSAPFHSSLMEPAAKELEAHFSTLEFKPNEFPYFANIDAKLHPIGTDTKIIQQNLVDQVAGSVLWTQSFLQVNEDTLCLELGPGRVLMGLARKINRNIKVLSMDKEGSFEELKELLS
jgi:[acyl-carrier-protein] S-malonyltransferase